ncbi:hypothetical protein LQ757_04020 [Agromyces sp. SYSU K20354]|uniref:NaeI family type II restriction endonuclease n=1 Tax=Agromyces cavernae TaxID=2898659 RepID=UPI001E44194F|nr:NaeI family type II restriction endonuclease [Agromyces cavernae]MCD2441441.1 hypothetical protein [Agromyces cavernae]
MGKVPKGWELERELRQEVPDELAPFVRWFYSKDAARERIRWALRDSLDELLDGQRTGRWAYQHLSKTEKTHLGTAVEVNLTKEFEFANGVWLDWQIDGIDIDCKFSKDLGGWEIPMEMYRCDAHGEQQGKADHPALLTWLNDDRSQWAAGLISVTDSRLRWRHKKDTGESVRAYNRDNKRRFENGTAVDIYWLWGGLQVDLPRNLLLHLNPESRDRIFGFSTGQDRVNQLFREVQEQIVGRQTVLTVAQQDDAPKRARDARIHLRSEGILILGHERSHARVAAALGMPTPSKGEWIAVRVTPVAADSPRARFVLDGKHWAAAFEAEPPSSAPILPRSADGVKLASMVGSV